MSCNFSDRFFVMNCGLCISGLWCQRKTLLLLLTLTLDGKTMLATAREFLYYCLHGRK